MKFVDSKFMWEEPDTVGPSLLGQDVQKFQKFLTIFWLDLLLLYFDETQNVMQILDLVILSSAC